LNEDEIREKFYQVSQIQEKVYRYYYEQSKTELKYKKWVKIIKNDP
jgi:hypothetical protein